MQAHAVLTDPQWLREITSFQAGLPGLIRVFQANEQAADGEQLDLVRAALAAQDLRVLEMLDRLTEQPQHAQQIRFGNALSCAASHGRLVALQWLFTRNNRLPTPESTEKLLDAVVAGSGDVQTAAWLSMQLPADHLRVSTAALENAASSGHLAILKWVHSSQTVEAAFQRSVMDSAAASGRLQLVQFLHDHRTEGCTPRAAVEAARQGHLDVLEFLFQWYPHHFVVSTEILDAATVQPGPDQLQIVQFLHETARVSCTVAAVDNAAASSDLDIVAYLLRERREGFSRRALVSAARSGRLDIVRLLLDHRERKDTYQRPEMDTSADLERAITAATQPGHTEIVQLLLDATTTPCNVSAAIRVASAWGREDIVRVLLAKGEWISLLDAISQASYQGHQEIVNLLKQAVQERQAAARRRIY